MIQNYTVIAEKGNIALIKRGEVYPEYAVVSHLVAKQERQYQGNDWDYTVGYWDADVYGLQNAIECFRQKTEASYVPRYRLEELATLFKDGLIEDDRESAMEYFTETCEMNENEMEFFGIEDDEEEE